MAPIKTNTSVQLFLCPFKVMNQIDYASSDKKRNIKLMETNRNNFKNLISVIIR